MQLAGRTFLVTGGGSGLGAACVREFAGAGANVVIADLNEETGAGVVADLSAGVRFIRADVTDEENVRTAIDLAYESFDGLHGAINCAGVVGVNLIGTFNVIRLAANAMVTRGGATDAAEEHGVFVNTASVAAFDGQIGQAAYSASKGGVVGMTLPIARELARYGIRVMTIAPGIFDTPMLAGLPEPARQSLGQQVPFPARLGNPSEYAMLARHIVENPMLNGEVIRLDGAIRMAPK